MSDTVIKIRDMVRDLVEARETNLGVEITVPVAYPGGDLVQVVVERSSDGYLVHDASFGSMIVTASGIRMSHSTITRFKEISQRFRCSFIEGRISTIATDNDLAIAIALVANASRAIADQSLEIRRHTDIEFRTEVTQRLREAAGTRVRENEEVKGESGRVYRLPAIVLDASQSRPEHFVATISNRNGVLNHVAEFYDLRNAHPAVKNDAVYDEMSDIRFEDRALLTRVCELIAFTQTKVRFRGMFGDATKN